MPTDEQTAEQNRGDLNFRDAEVKVTVGEAYYEDPDFVPDATARIGTLDTSGTAGAAHSDLREISKVFEIADRQDAIYAARALDPNDDEVSASTVIIPDAKDRDQEAVDRLRDKARRSTGEVQVAGRTPAQRDAAEGESDVKEAGAQQPATEDQSNSGTPETDQPKPGAETGSNAGPRGARSGKQSNRSS